MTRAARSFIWIIVITVFSWLMIDLTLPYLGFRHDVDFLLTKQKIIHLKHWRYAFYTHILLSILTLIAGLTQFSKYVLKRHKRIHRIMGYIYAIDVICLAGPSGLVMAFYANGTFVSRASFVILSLCWIFFTAVAISKVFKKDFTGHEKWMIRSYALTLSAISLRLMALVFPHFIHLTANDEYALIAWLSWTLNWVIAECIIFFKNYPPSLAD